MTLGCSIQCDWVGHSIDYVNVRFDYAYAAQHFIEQVMFRVCFVRCRSVLHTRRFCCVCICSSVYFLVETSTFVSYFPLFSEVVVLNF